MAANVASVDLKIYLISHVSGLQAWRVEYMTPAWCTGNLTQLLAILTSCKRIPGVPRSQVQRQLLAGQWQGVR